MSERPFLIWLTEHGAWWRPKADGCCVNISDAGIFTDHTSIARAISSVGGEGRYRKVYLDEVAADIDLELEIHRRKIAALLNLASALGDQAAETAVAA